MFGSILALCGFYQSVLYPFLLCSVIIPHLQQPSDMQEWDEVLGHASVFRDGLLEGRNSVLQVDDTFDVIFSVDFHLSQLCLLVGNL